MHKFKVAVASLGAVPLLLFAAAAVADQGVDVNVTNDGTEDVVVTIYDMNVQPRGVILSHARINGFTTVPVSVAMDAAGHANISWVAISADTGDRKCGHGNNVALDEAGALKVHADSTCSDLSAGS